MKRIGLFGGTFDPVHTGHLRTAWEVRENFGLDRIYFIPAAVPPHKKDGALADAQARLQMIRLAVADTPEFAVSDIELMRTGPSYTIDTVQYFMAQMEGSDGCYFILGADAFLEIDTWRAFEALFDHIAMIVMTRPGASGFDPYALGDFLLPYIHRKISRDYRFNPVAGAYEHPRKKAIHPTAVTPMEVSSTHIRRLIKNGRSIRFLVPDAVREYIQTKGLYA